jgi:glutamate carboxypeptidase
MKPTPGAGSLLRLLGATLVIALFPGTVEGQQLSPVEAAIVAEARSGATEAVELLRRLVEIPSGTMSHEGVREVGAVLEVELDALGFQSRWIDMPPEMDRAGHLFGEKAGSQGPTLLLIGHLDTVFERDDPFHGFTVDGTQGIGPGANDMKGGDVVLIHALKALQAAGVLEDLSIIVAFTGDEESPGMPLDLARRDLVEAAQRADIALGFEGGVRDEFGEHGTVARRSSSEWILRVEGRQAHSSGIFSEDVGAGAIFETARILNGFYEEVRGEEYLTFNAGSILGGTEVTYEMEMTRGTAFGKTNVVPNAAIVHGGIRTISQDQLERAQDAMRAVVARHLPRTDASIEFIDGYPAMAPTEANQALLRTLSQVNQDLGRGPMEPLDPSRRGAADISFAAPHVEAALAGLGAYGSGAHAPGETVDLASLPDVIARAALLIYRITRAGPATD